MSEQITSVRIEIKTDSDEHVIVRLIDARVMSAAEVRAKAVAFLDESCGALSEPSELTALTRDVAAIRELLSAVYSPHRLDVARPVMNPYPPVNMP